MTISFSTFAEYWFASMQRASVQGAVAVLVVWLTLGLLRRVLYWPAWAEHWLWRLAYLKFIVALVIATPFDLPLLAPVKTIGLKTANAGERLADSKRTERTEKTEATEEKKVVQAGQSIEAPLKATGTQVASNSPTVVNWRGVLFFGWVAGCFLGLWRLLLDYRRIAGIQAAPIDVAWMHTLVADLAKRHRLASRPSIAVSDRLPVPALIGIFRPRLVFSKEILRDCDRDQTTMVIHHELAHAARRDPVWNLLPCLVQVLFFFHPCVWLAHRSWRAGSEAAADELAIDSLKLSASEYAEKLVEVAAVALGPKQNQHSLGVVAVLSSYRSLRQRISTMDRYRVLTRRAEKLFVSGLTVTALLGLLPFQLTRRADAAPPETGKTAASSADAATFGKNMGFEEMTEEKKANDWGGGGEGYTLSLDDANAKSGKTCAWIIGSSEFGFGTYTQCMNAEPLRGKRIEYSGYLQSDVKGTGGLWMRIDAGRKPIGFDNMSERRVSGQSEWKQYRIVLDVPTEATNICFGFLMTGNGSLRGDDLAIKVLGPLGEGPAVTGDKIEVDQTVSLPKSPKNLGFEVAGSNAFPKNWGGGGVGYQLVRDTETKHAGQASGRIAKAKDQAGFGTFTQGVAADDYRGKRVRWSGTLKTEKAGPSGLWMRIDGESGATPLGFDNMSERAVKGTTEWTDYSVVLDVPEQATAIYFGFLLSGDGKVWGDDLKLEIVGNLGEGPATTAMKLD